MPDITRLTWRRPEARKVLEGEYHYCFAPIEVRIVADISSPLRDGLIRQKSVPRAFLARLLEDFWKLADFLLCNQAMLFCCQLAPTPTPCSLTCLVPMPLLSPSLLRRLHLCSRRCERVHCFTCLTTPLTLLYFQIILKQLSTQVSEASPDYSTGSMSRHVLSKTTSLLCHKRQPKPFLS